MRKEQVGRARQNHCQTASTTELLCLRVSEEKTRETEPLRDDTTLRSEVQGWKKRRVGNSYKINFISKS